MKQDNRTYIILILIGLIFVVWFAILIAPLDGGLIKIIAELPQILKNPFNINICENSLKTIFILVLFYFVGIGVYFSTRKNYKRGKEYGSAEWGNPREINKKYKSFIESENRILTQNIRIGLDAKRHRRNLNTLVIGRKWCR